MRRISVTDTTLRTLCEDGGRALLFREKIALASAIGRIGADCLELPALQRPKEDAVVVRTIAASCGLRLLLPVGDDVDAAYEAVKCAARPELLVELPVSVVQMEYLCAVNDRKMLAKVEKTVAEACAKGCPVQFMAADAGRADLHYLKTVCLAAEKAGAASVGVADDAGLLLPEEAAALTKELKAVLSVPLVWRFSDACHLALADAVAALSAGADGVKLSLSGPGLKTADLADLLKIKGAGLDWESGLALSEIYRDIGDMMKDLSHRDYLSGVTAEKAGGEVALDSASTLKDVAEAAVSLGYDLSEEDKGKVHEALMGICRRKPLVGARELDAIIASVAMQVPSSYHLASYIISTSDKTDAMAHISLTKDGETLSGVACGDGPIDSAFLAIEQCIGFHYELDDFQIQAVTEGRESLGATLVKLRSGGKLYSGNGLSPDIVGSSIRAYLNALNKIVYEEQA